MIGHEAYDGAVVSGNVSLIRAWVNRRTPRPTDGPDEVNRAAIARSELREG